MENILKLYLAIDIDDVYVNSSPLLQQMVNDKTNFKTATLKMFEQLKRNCQYLVKEVTKECELAKSENRSPKLDRFLIFGEYIENKSDMYERPILAAKYYEVIADKFLNQFLEERDTFLEIDNMPKGSRKYFNYEKEMAVINQISLDIFNNKEAFHKINAFCLDSLKKLIKDAKDRNDGNYLIIPDYGDLVKMDSNDIIKDNSIEQKENIETILYERPIKNLENCIKNENRMIDIVTNSDVYFKPSERLIDYDKIHREENIKKGAKEFFSKLRRELIKLDILEGSTWSSHKTGLFETIAKEKNTGESLPEVENFIAFQFHEEEHNAARRGRSSKTRKTANKLHIDPRQILLIDDSIENCKDCKKKGGLAILYRPLTDAEKINGKVEDTGFPRIYDFSDESLKLVLDEAIKHFENINAKQKKL